MFGPGTPLQTSLCYTHRPSPDGAPFVTCRLQTVPPLSHASAVGKYQLYYYALKGRGQAIRYIFAEKDLEYEEIDIDAEWTTKYKPHMAFGQVPMLNDDGFELVQSCAILRYLGRKHGLNPADVKDQAKIDMVNDYCEEIRGQYVNLIYGDYDGEKPNFVKGLPDKLEKLEKLFASWGDDYITKEMTWADYNLFDLFDILQILAPGCMDACPKLTAYFQRVASRPKVKAHRDSEGFKKMPVNYNDKQ